MVNSAILFLMLCALSISTIDKAKCQAFRPVVFYNWQELFLMSYLVHFPFYGEVHGMLLLAILAING